MTFRSPHDPIYTCALCGGFYSHTPEARQSHFTVMGHSPRPKEHEAS